MVDPTEVADKYGVDALRYFLLREVPFGLDGDFSEAALINRINTELANDFGNLHSRVFKMVAKFFNSEVPEPAETEQEMKALAEGILEDIEGHLKVLQFQRALEGIWKLVSFVNKYIDTNAPWALAKDPAEEGRLRTVLYSSAEALRFLALYLHPFMPGATAKLWRTLGQGEEKAPGRRAAFPANRYRKKERDTKTGEEKVNGSEIRRQHHKHRLSIEGRAKDRQGPEGRSGGGLKQACPPRGRHRRAPADSGRNRQGLQAGGSRR
jgi:methionyl-tRNA synthetase